MLRHLMSAREICWRAASKTRRTRHAIVCDDATRRTTRLHQTLHTTTPPEDETECPACSEPTQPPGRSWCAPLGDAWETEKTSPWTPVWQQQSRSGTRSTKTRPRTPECRRTQGPHQQ
jgi:hypothetical protein